MLLISCAKNFYTPIIKKRKLYPKFLILSKLSLIIGAVIVFTEINKVIGGSLTTAAYTLTETGSVNKNY